MSQYTINVETGDVARDGTPIGKLKDLIASFRKTTLTADERTILADVIEAAGTAFAAYRTTCQTQAKAVVDAEVAKLNEQATTLRASTEAALLTRLDEMQAAELARQATFQTRMDEINADAQAKLAALAPTPVTEDELVEREAQRIIAEQRIRARVFARVKELQAQPVVVESTVDVGAAVDEGT